MLVPAVPVVVTTVDPRVLKYVCPSGRATSRTSPEVMSRSVTVLAVWS
ncbi:hypothetical protein AB0454_44225 [Streptomyces sp. NPDC093509]